MCTEWASDVIVQGVLMDLRVLNIAILETRMIEIMVELYLFNGSQGNCKVYFRPLLKIHSPLKEICCTVCGK